MSRIVAGAAQAPARELPRADAGIAAPVSRGVVSIDEAISRFLAQLEPRDEVLPEAAAAMALPAANAAPQTATTPWLVAIVQHDPAAQTSEAQSSETQPSEAQSSAAQSSAAQSSAAQTSEARSPALDAPPLADKAVQTSPQSDGEVATGVYRTLGGLEPGPTATAEKRDLDTRAASASAATSQPAEAAGEDAVALAPAARLTTSRDEDLPESDPEDPQRAATPSRTARGAGAERRHQRGSSDDDSHSRDRRVTASFERARESSPPPSSKGTAQSAQSAQLPRSEAARTLSGYGAVVSGAGVTPPPLEAAPSAPASVETEAARIADEIEPEVSEALSRLRPLGDGRATVRLEHPSLGSIRVDLDLQGDSVDIRLIAATSSAAIALRESELGLRQAFGLRSSQLRYRVSTRGPDDDDEADSSSS